MVVFGTIFLVMIARGYSFDLLSGQIKETGLVIINSQPGGATISFNYKKSKNKTPYRLVNADPGELTLGLSLNGYRDWLKKVIVRAQEVSFADHALLIPQNLSYENPYQNLKVQAMVGSAERRKTIYLSNDPKPSLWYTEGSGQPTLLYQPKDTANPATLVSEIDSLILSDNGNQLFFRQVSPAGSEYLVITVGQNQTPVNLTETFRVNSATISFNPSNDRELFWLDNGAIRRIDLDGKTISAVLADTVVTQKVKNDRIFYITAITPTNPNHELWSMDFSGQRKQKILPSVVDSPEYVIDYAKRQNVEYLALYIPREKTVTLYSDIYDKINSSIISKDARGFSFSPNDKYLVVDHANTLRTYDLEYNEHFNFKTDLSGLTSWDWLDDYHLLVMRNGTIHIMDYDGQNDEILTAPGDAALAMTPASDEKSILYQNGSAIKQVFLTLKRN